MNKAASTIAASALLLGLAADLLLRRVPWGLNMALFVALCLGAAFFCCRAAGRSIHPFAALAAVVAGLGMLWRASGILVFLDVVLLLIFVPLLALGARNVRMVAAGLSHIAVAHVVTCLQAVAGLPQLLFGDLSWRGLPRIGRTGVVLRGFLMALPALLIFGALLVSADAAFAKILRDLIDFNPQEAVLHVVVTAVGAAISAGFLRSFALSGPAPTLPRPEFVRMPKAETNIAIGLIDLLFAAFVVVQFHYFFGGSETMRIGSMTYSEYARRGFFELVVVVMLVLPMLLAVEWLAGGSKTFRVLAGIQIALVLVIAASAYRRMQLYRDEYGLTEQRLYTTAFMIWLAVLLVWFAGTVLAGHRSRFAAGALVTAVASVVILHAINPDAIIVRTNLARAAAGKRAFDYKYAKHLSTDAAEEMVKAGFTDFVANRRPPSWRTWNLSRARAYELGVERHAAEPGRSR